MLLSEFLSEVKNSKYLRFCDSLANKRIMIDLDKTIHKYSEGYKDGSVYDEPIKGAREIISKLRKDGFKIWLLTARLTSEGGEHQEEQIKLWLLRNGIIVDGITGEKLPALLYIDDRGMEFASSEKWDESFYKEILERVKTTDSDFIESKHPRDEDGKFSSVNNIQDAIKFANFEYEGFTPKEITHGHCYEWALAVKEKLPDAKVKEIDLWKFRGKTNLPYHVFVEYQGKYFDAETMNGVKDWKDLNYYKEHVNQTIIKKAKIREMPTFTKDSLPSINFQGIKIDIENKKGSVRKGEDEDGNKWKTKMFYPYGYIRNTGGEKDGDEIDVFVGPDKDSSKVFIIDNVENGKFDEHKVMLGFKNGICARDAFLAHYDDSSHLGTIKEMSIFEFKKMLEETMKIE